MTCQGARRLSKKAGTPLTVAVVATVLFGLAAFFAVGIGMNVYLDDYCAHRDGPARRSRELVQCQRPTLRQPHHD